MKRWGSLEDSEGTGELQFRTFEMEHGDRVRWRLPNGAYIEVRAPYDEFIESIDVHGGECRLLIKPLTGKDVMILPDLGD